MQRTDRSFTTVVLLSLGAGAVLAVLASASSGHSWYARREWDTSRITATLDHVENDRTNNTLAFWYKVENKTGRDYRIDQTAEASLFAKFDGPRGASKYQLLQLQHPIAVPAGRSAAVRLDYGRACPSAPGASPPTGQAAILQRELISCINKEYASLGGFVLYDRKNRYGLDFGLDWAKADPGR